MALLGGYCYPLVTISACPPQLFCKIVMGFFGGLRFLLQRAADGRQVQKASQKECLDWQRGHGYTRTGLHSRPTGEVYLLHYKKPVLRHTAITVSRDPT